MGAAAGLIILGVLAWWLVKKNQNKTVAPAYATANRPEEDLKSGDYYAHVAEAPDNMQYPEAEGTSVPWELHAESSTPRPKVT